MREIKFRAWHETYGMMQVSILSVCTDGAIHYFTDNTRGGYYDLDNPKNTLMQYTGIKDKNGVEIYEGDMLTSTYYRGWSRKTGVHRYDIKKAFVKYQENVAGFILQPIPQNQGFILFNQPSLEVIGNIYENPELLEESK